MKSLGRQYETLAVDELAPGVAIVTLNLGLDAGNQGEAGLFLEARGLTRGDVTTRPIGDGHSNLTFLVPDGSRRVSGFRPSAGPCSRPWRPGSSP
jgi:hypothetical protein